MLSHKTQIPQSDTIFTNNSYVASLKHKARIAKAKVLGYRLSKWSLVVLLMVGLLSAGTFSASAGYYKSKPSKNVYKVNKKVKVNNRAGIRTGGSDSNASVNNGININVGGRSGGGARFVANRGGGGKKHHRNNNNNNRGGKKKVVRVKRVVRNIDNSVVDNSYVDNSYNDNSINNDIDQSIVNKTKYVVKQPYNDCYDNCYDDNWGDYSDDCGCYTKYSYSSKTKVVNNNNNTNDNYNKQIVDTSY